MQSGIDRKLPFLLQTLNPQDHNQLVVSFLRDCALSKRFTKNCSCDGMHKRWMKLSAIGLER